MDSDNIQVTFKEGRQKVFPRGITLSEALKAMDESHHAWIAARVDGDIVDLSRVLEVDVTVEGLTAESA